MFGPKHTVESVAKELIDGFDQGTVVLRREESPQITMEITFENLEGIMKSALARSRRKEAFFVGLGLTAAAVGIAVVTVQIVSHVDASQGTGWLRYGWPLAVLVSLVGVVVGFLVGRRAGERSAELNTFIRIYKLADQNTARRLAQREAPKLLRGREFQAAPE